MKESALCWVNIADHHATWWCLSTVGEIWWLDGPHSIGFLCLSGICLSCFLTIHCTSVGIPSDGALLPALCYSLGSLSYLNLHHENKFLIRISLYYNVHVTNKYFLVGLAFFFFYCIKSTVTWDFPVMKNIKTTPHIPKTLHLIQKNIWTLYKAHTSWHLLLVT